MVRVCFCADTEEALKNLHEHVKEALADLPCTIESFLHSMDLLDQIYNDRPEHCAVFLDSNDDFALEMAKMIQKFNPKYRFNLFSGVSYEAQDLYSAGVTFFVKKPYEFPMVSKCADNVIEFYSDIKPQYLTLKHRSGTEVIRYSEIKYVMSDKRKAIVCCDVRHSEYYYKLDEIEVLLDKNFVRCHQSYIVNMKRIKEFIEDGILLYDDTFVPVSRNKYFAVRRQYQAFISGE